MKFIHNSIRFAYSTLASLSILLLLTVPGRATTLIPVADDDLIVSSRAIVRGTVLAVECRLAPSRDRVYTYFTIRLDEVLKGRFQTSEIVVRQLGGQTEELTQVFFGSPQFAVGEEVLLYLSTADDGALRVAHFCLGKFTVKTDERGVRTVVRFNSDIEAVKVETPDARAVTDSAPWDTYRKMIRRTLVRQADRVAEFERTEAGRPMLPVPPEFVRDGAGSRFQSNFSFLGDGFRWHEADSGAPIPYKVNPLNAPTGNGGVQEFAASLAAWTDIPNASIILQNGGQTSVCGFIPDGTNSVSFGDCRREIQDPINCTGILAIGGVSAATNETKVINGRPFRRITESDVVFNNNFECFLGITSNLAEVLTHEIGHSIGLGHSSENPAESNPILFSATMFFRAHGDGRGAAVRLDDIDGAAFIYPGSGNPNGPAIFDFSPASGPVGTQITISGRNFTGATAVRIGGVNASAFTVVNASTITATVGSGAVTGLVAAVTPEGTALSSNVFTVIVAPPTITSFTPTSGPPGTVVTITGTNFVNVLSVAFNNRNATFTVNGPTSITATVAAVTTSGPVTVSTFGGTATSSTNFTVTTGQPPSVVSFSPAAGPPGSTVAITGTNLGGASGVTFNGSSATFSIVSGSEITATVPPDATSGPVGVTTSNGTATSREAFIVQRDLPLISSFSPTSGAPGTLVTLTGVNFTGATDVKFNATKAQFTVVSATSATATVPTGATSGPVSLTTPAGTAFSAAGFTVNATNQAPKITGFTPPAGTAGTVVTIDGQNFTGATSVEFNGTRASFGVVSDERLTATVPTGATSGLVRVTTPSGTSTSPEGFIVRLSPTIAQVSPSSGRVGTPITVTGSNFAGAVVAFGQTTAQIVENTGSRISTSVPTGLSPGAVLLTVTVPGGTASTGFIIESEPAPTLTAVTPKKASVGATVTLTGANLTGATVNFGTIKATVTNNTGTQLQTTVPEGAKGKLTVMVTTPGGTASTPFKVKK